MADITPGKLAVEDFSAAGFTMVNHLNGMPVLTKSRKPIIANGTGGMAPAVFPVAPANPSSGASKQTSHYWYGGVPRGGCLRAYSGRFSHWGGNQFHKSICLPDHH